MRVAIADPLGARFGVGALAGLLDARPLVGGGALPPGLALVGAGLLLAARGG